VPFITFFLLRDFESLRNRLLNALPNRYFELGWLIFFKVADQTEGYVRAVLIQQSILATVASIGFWIAGFESPIILGMIAGILGLIPYLGPALGLIPPFYLVLASAPVNYDSMYAAIAVIGVAYVIDNLFVIPLDRGQVCKPASVNSTFKHYYFWKLFWHTGHDGRHSTHGHLEYYAEPANAEFQPAAV